MANGSGPYLSAAFLCERVLQEADSVLSAIRIVDRLTQSAVGPDAPEEMPPLSMQLFALVAFKSGSARGSMQVDLRPEDPSGRQLGTFGQTVHFEGEDRGVNMIVGFNFVAEIQGLYWFDVLLQGERVTRIPLRVLYVPTRLPGQ
jgi:hypothetical protein